MAMFLYTFKNAKNEVIAYARGTDDIPAKYQAGVSQNTNEVTFTKTSVAS